MISIVCASIHTLVIHHEAEYCFHINEMVLNIYIIKLNIVSVSMEAYTIKLNIFAISYHKANYWRDINGSIYIRYKRYAFSPQSLGWVESLGIISHVIGLSIDALDRIKLNIIVVKKGIVAREGEISHRILIVLDMRKK